ncbi:MAG TPA: hypothetical protein DEA05_02820 [Rhodobacteraceae bacterium]|nr:hypothetical protein [Paracoccaceae bacterium]
MIARIPGAAMRGLLVALLVATPFLLLPGAASEAPEIIVLLALVAALLTFLEYNATYPSFVEFRDAPPLNRIRFVALFAMVLALTLIARHGYEPSTLTALVVAFGGLVGQAMDFPYSPVRLLGLMMQADADPAVTETLRSAAGLAYATALCAVAAFGFLVRMMGWPIGMGAFNVWINLPLFDPTTGGDVVARLQRDGRGNIILGVLLPFLIPAIVKAGVGLFGPVGFSSPQTLIWTISAWAFLPASMVMRGIAMLRVADLIEEKRRRAYANAEAVQTA